MDGVNVLYTYEVHTGTWVGIAMLILCATMICVTVYAMNNINHYLDVFGALLAVLLATCFGAMTLSAFAYTESRIKATISPEVNLIEFNEHYEIVEQEGDIYTLIDKESEGK